MRQIIRLQFCMSVCVCVCLSSCSYVVQCRRSCSWKTLRAAAAPAPGLATGVMQRDTRVATMYVKFGAALQRYLCNFAPPLPLPLPLMLAAVVAMLETCLPHNFQKLKFSFFELLPPLVAESVCNACLGPFGVACLLLLANSTN